MILSEIKQLSAQIQEKAKQILNESKFIEILERNLLTCRQSKCDEILCINGLQKDKHCVEWHLKYRDNENMIWQIDIIHIEEGSQYDGYF